MSLRKTRRPKRASEKAAKAAEHRRVQRGLINGGKKAQRLAEAAFRARQDREAEQLLAAGLEPQR